MSRIKDLDRQYEIAGQDAQGWLEQARKLKYSADVIRVAFLAIKERSATIDDVRVKQLAYLDAYMMLTGFAFENLIKGIDIAANPQRVANRKLNTKGWQRGGHSLSEYASTVKLSPEKTHLLRRLEEFIVWAGRYNIPRDADTYIESFLPENLKTLYSTDFALVDELFGELTAALVAVWRVNGALKW